MVDGGLETYFAALTELKSDLEIAILPGEPASSVR